MQKVKKLLLTLLLSVMPVVTTWTRPPGLAVIAPEPRAIDTLTVYDYKPRKEGYGILQWMGRGYGLWRAVRIAAD